MNRPLAPIGLHRLGVAPASRPHRKDLAATIVTGRQRPFWTDGMRIAYSTNAYARRDIDATLPDIVALGFEGPYALKFCSDSDAHGTASAWALRHLRGLIAGASRRSRAAA